MQQYRDDSRLQDPQDAWQQMCTRCADEPSASELRHVKAYNAANSDTEPSGLAPSVGMTPPCTATAPAASTSREPAERLDLGKTHPVHKSRTIPTLPLGIARGSAPSPDLSETAQDSARDASDHVIFLSHDDERNLGKQGWPHNRER